MLDSGGVAFGLVHVRTIVSHPRSHDFPCTRFQGEDACTPVKMSVVMFVVWLCTYLNHKAYGAERYYTDEVVYAGYRVVMMSSHKHDDSLGNMKSWGQPSSSARKTHLDQKEKGNVSGMEALECDVARPICLVLFSVTDKGYTLCNIANDGWLNFDGLDVN